jgi:hypothetical protein
MAPKMLWVSQVDSGKNACRLTGRRWLSFDSRRVRSRGIAVPILAVTINKAAHAGPVAHGGVVFARNIASRAPGAACTAMAVIV